MRLQRDVALAQLGDAMRKLGLIPVEVSIGEEGWQLDHDPALQRRAHADDGSDWNPRQHDVRFLVWRPKAPHLRKTTGRRGTSRYSSDGGGDTSQAAKLKRLSADQEAFRARMLAKEPGQARERSGSIPTRGFAKGSRPLRSRNSFQSRSTT